MYWCGNFLLYFFVLFENSNCLTYFMFMNYTNYWFIDLFICLLIQRVVIHKSIELSHLDIL